MLQKIIDSHEAENSCDNIPACLGVPKSKAQSLINKFSQFGNIELLSGQAWYRKLLEKTVHKLYSKVNINSKGVQADIAERLDTEGTLVRLKA